MMPTLPQSWARARQQSLTALAAHQAPLLPRQQRWERQSQRLLDAYQAEIITLSEFQTRRQKLTTDLQPLAQESQS